MRRRYQLAEPLRPRQQIDVQPAVEQVEVQGVGQALLQLRGLAGPARSEQKEAVAQLQRFAYGSGIHDSSIHAFMPKFQPISGEKVS